MYEPLLFIHSWMRWIVLLAMIYFFAKSTVGWLRLKPWTAGDNHFIWAFNQAIGYQILFGLTLWLSASPFAKAGFKDGSLLETNIVVFFWTVRHPATMFGSFCIFHAGRVLANRAPSQRRNLIYSATFGLLLIAVLSAIPWPGLAYGRSLLRWFD